MLTAEGEPAILPLQQSKTLETDPTSLTCFGKLNSIDRIYKCSKDQLIIQEAPHSNPPRPLPGCWHS